MPDRVTIHVVEKLKTDPKVDEALPTFGEGQTRADSPGDRGKASWSKTSTPKPRAEYRKNQVLLDANKLIPHIGADGFSTNGRFHNHTNLLLGPLDRKQRLSPSLQVQIAKPQTQPLSTDRNAQTSFQETFGTNTSVSEDLATSA